VHKNPARVIISGLSPLSQGFVMVVIRLARGGKKARPFFTLVATDKRNRRDGRFIERLGFYNPVASGNEPPLRIAQDRVDYWLSQGAQVSEKAASLIKRLSDQKASQPAAAA
jgi:small subunit ribosomal protein S16